MVKLAQIAQISQLIEQVETVADRLTPNELEMFHHLKSKYAEPVQGHFDDATCLEVILRNVAIRREYAHSPQSAAGRRIDLPRQPRDED